MFAAARRLSGVTPRYERPPVHLAASLGGHLELLLTLRPSLDRYQPVWVTAAQRGADTARELGDGVVDVPRLNRSRPFTAVRNMWGALRAVLRERPDVIVTSGAGSVVAFCVFARLLGAQVIFIETMARVTSPSASGRVLSRIARLVIVQWKEMARVYRGAVVCRPALWDDVAEAGNRPRVGTFVAVGTHRHPFDRLLEVVDRAVEAGILPGPVIAQTGNCRYRPRHLAAQQWMSPDQLAVAIDNAEFVIGHAGSGIISAALRSGHKPLILPRRASRSEHVDDHQVQIVRKLGSLGVIVPLDGDGEISHAHIAAAREEVSRPEGVATGTSVSEVLDEHLAELLGGPGRASADAAVTSAAA